MTISPVTVAVDIEVSNSGIPVKAPTKLFKDFDDDNFFNDLVVADVAMVEAVAAVADVVVLEEEKVVATPPTPTPPWDGDDNDDGAEMIQGLIFILTNRSI